MGMKIQIANRMRGAFHMLFLGLKPAGAYAPPPEPTLNSAGYTPSSALMSFTVGVYASSDCTGRLLHTTASMDPGVCQDARTMGGYSASLNLPSSHAMAVGGKLKRHCLCGDRRFRQGASIPTWGTRTCNLDELKWACSDDAVQVGSSASSGRAYMIEHCCDQAVENEHFEWTACSINGQEEMDRVPDNYCTTSLRATGAFSNCRRAAAGSDCINLQMQPPRSQKVTISYSPPPFAPGARVPLPPPSPAPLHPAANLIRTITDLRDTISKVQRGDEQVDLYLASDNIFAFGGQPIKIREGRRIRIFAGDGGMPVLDGGGTSRLFDVEGDRKHCAKDADCATCDVAQICGSGTYLGPCAASCGTDGYCYINRPALTATGGPDCCQGVTNGYLGPGAASSTPGPLVGTTVAAPAGTKGALSGYGYCWGATNAHQALQISHSGYGVNDWDFLGSYCWTNVLGERCYAKQDDPELIQTKLVLAGVHLTNGRATNTVANYKNYLGAGGCIRAFYSKVTILGGKMSNCLAEDKSANTRSSDVGMGGGGAIFMLAGKLELYSYRGIDVEISGCRATDEDAISHGGAIAFVPVLPHHQNMQVHFIMSGVTIHDTKAMRGGAVAVVSSWASNYKTFTDVLIKFTDVEIRDSHAAPHAADAKYNALSTVNADAGEGHTYQGGAIYLMLADTWQATMSRLYLHDCSAMAGAGIWAASPLQLHDSRFERLYANVGSRVSESTAGSGGGLFFTSASRIGACAGCGQAGDAPLNVSNTHFTDCAANTSGAGAMVHGHFAPTLATALTDVTFTRCGINNTRSSYAVGGGLGLWPQENAAPATQVLNTIVLRRLRFIACWVQSDSSGAAWKAIHTAGSNSGGGGGMWAYVTENGRANIKMHDSMFEDCQVIGTGDKGLARGGGVLIWTAEIAMELHNVNLTNCSATASGGVIAEGGGLHRTEPDLRGRVQFLDGTLFSGNSVSNSAGSTAPTIVGHQFKIQGGDSVYKLPAPPGRYIIGTECTVQRKSCAVNTDFTYVDPNCEASSEACSLVADWGVWGVAGPPTLTQGPYAGQQCRPSTNVFQVCNWRAHADLLGVFFEAISHADDEYPPLCAAGILGSDQPSHQMSPVCKGICPAGAFCPTEGTTEAVPCKAGHYCPAGTSVAIPCAAGSYGSATDLIAQAQCSTCLKGHYCAAGATAPMPCQLGTFNSQLGQSECTQCSPGMFSSELAATSCNRCGEGNYSSNVLSCLPCGIGEYCPLGSRTGIKCATLFTTTLDFGAILESECVCRKGMYMHTTSTQTTLASGNVSTTYESECVTCPEPGEKTNCTREGATLETLPVMPGYWRSQPASTEIRWCFTPEACVGGANLSAQCRLGHTGAFCDACLPGWNKDTMKLCQECARGAGWGTSLLMMALLVAVACLAGGLGTWCVAKKAKDSKMLQKDHTEGMFAKNKVSAAEPTQPRPGVAVGGPPSAAIGWPAMTLPQLMMLYKVKFPDLDWPELPDIELWQLQAPGFKPAGFRLPFVTLPNVDLPGLRVQFPHLHWASMSGMSLPHLFNILKIAFPTLTWPDMPPFDLPAWGWPDMPPLKHPHLVPPSFSLPHWSGGLTLMGFNFEGFSIKLRILISLFQVLTQLNIVYSIPWPPMLSGLLSWLNVIQFDFITFVPLGCVMEGLNFYASVLFQTLLLPILAIPMLLLGLCKSNPTVKFIRTKYQDVLFWILFIIYPAVSTKIFGIFGCTTVDAGVGVERIAWLRADLSIPCSGATYSLMYAYSVLMVFVYPLGTPALYYYLMRRNAIALDKLQSNQVLRAKLVEEHKAASRFDLAEHAMIDGKRGKPNAFQRQASKAWRVDPKQFKALPVQAQSKLSELAIEDVRERKALPPSIKKLIKGYEMRAWYFEIFECFRKLSLACLPVFFQPSGSPGQLVFGLLVCFIAFGAYVAIDPFDDVANDTLAKICQAQIFFSLLSSVLLSYDEGTRADSTNLDLLLVFLWVMPFVLAIFLQSPVMMVMKKVATARGNELAKEAEKAVDAKAGPAAPADISVAVGDTPGERNVSPSGRRQVL